MTRSTNLPDLLEPLYDSCESGDVTPFFEQLRRATGSSIVCSLDIDFATGGGQITNIVGAPKNGEIAEIERRYMEEFAPRNSLVEAAAPHIAPGAVLRITDYASFEQIRETDYYRHFLRPLDMDYTTGLIVEADTGFVQLVSLSRPVGDRDYRDTDLSFFHQLLPHLQRVLRLRGYFDRNPTWQALEAAGACAAQLNRNLEIRRLTDAMQALIAERSLFIQRRSQLMGVTGEAQTFLLQLAARALSFAGSGQRAPEVRTWDTLGRAWQITAFDTSAFGPLQSQPGDLLLIVKDLTFEHAHDYLTHRYGLTPAEVACALAMPGSVRAVAEGLGLSMNTVKSHLKAIYQKTGVRSQAELVGLLARERLL